MGKNEDETSYEPENEPSSEESGFLTRSEAAKKIGISVSKLRILEAAGRIPKPAPRPGSNSSVPVFPEAVISEYLTEHGEKPENALAELLVKAKDLLTQEQSHMARMFDKYMGLSDKLFGQLTDNLKNQHDHIMALEKQAFDMREAADKVLNLEHERKMAELKENRKEQMQKVAIQQVMQFAGPYLQKKLGIEIPVQGSGEPSQEALLGQAVVGMLIGMPDEKFASLKDIVGEEAFNVLSGVRIQAKGAN